MLEASKISSNGFALDFFPLTVSPTGLKILGGGFVLLSDLASPWWPVILPFLKGWRAAVEINERWEVMCHQAFGRCLMKNPSKNSLIWPLSYWGHGPTRRWISKAFKSRLGGLDVHDSNTSVYVKRWHDTSPHPFLFWEKNGISSSSETRQHGYFGFNNKNDSFIMIPNRLNLASMKDPDVFFSDCDQLGLTYCFSVWTECISREIRRFCHEMKW